jgi:glutathione S-transferase
VGKSGQDKRMYTLHGVHDWASLAIRMALAELDQPFTYVAHDPTDLGTEAYLAIHPFGKIPALETPQGPVFETGAILLWLTGTHGQLAPALADADRGAFLSWFLHVANTVHPGMMGLLHPYRPAGEAAAGLVGPIARDRLRESYGALDRVAASGVWWLSGDRPSILSLYLAMLMRWTSAFAKDPDLNIPVTDYPALAGVLRALEVRPAVQKVAKVEGLGLKPFTEAA